MSAYKKICWTAIAVTNLLAIIFTSTNTHAEQGITSTSILIGQSAAFTGMPSEEVKQATAGAKMHFDLINEQGGIFGRKIVLESMDDGFEPKRTLENTYKLINEKGAFALFLYRGTPTTEAIVPLLNESKIPLIAPVTGATSLHQPRHRYLFNVRPKYRDEVSKIVEQLSGMGLKKLAVLASNDSFGKDALGGLNAAATAQQLSNVTIATYERNTVDVADAVQKILTAEPAAILMFCTAKPCDAFIRQYRKAGGFQPLFTLSNVSSPSFISGLAELSRGLGITQVFPNPKNTTIPISKEFQAALKKNPDLISSYPTFEGYIAAKVLVEGLRKAGARPTRERLVSALEGFDQFDIGGLALHYSPISRSGLDFVELSVIGKNGVVLR